MNKQETEIATQIWPQHMAKEIIPYGEKVAAALEYLGDRYLCFKPSNRPAR